MKNQYTFLAIVIVILLAGTVLYAASQKKDTAVQQLSYTTITAQEAKKLMTENANAVIVDVRTRAEYDEIHIPGAVLVPNETIGNTAPSQLPEKNALLLIYCRSGNRSRQAAEKLAALGYTQVYNFGGIINWPYETVSEQ
jgi:rhodanese-related sulfurtransferase